MVGALGWFVMFRTRFGLHVQAVGGNEESAVANGVNARRVRVAVYLISAVLAALAAILLIARVGAAEPAANTAFLLNSVAAVVLGGVSLTRRAGHDRRPDDRRAAAHRPHQRTDPARRLAVLPATRRRLVVVLAALLTRFQKK